MTRTEFELEIMRMLNQGVGGAALLDHDQDQREEIARLREAVGLATTLKPGMEINVNDPVGMMQEIHKYVTSALAKEATRDTAE